MTDAEKLGAAMRSLEGRHRALADLREELEFELVTQEANLRKNPLSAGTIYRISQLKRWLENLP